MINLICNFVFENSPHRQIGAYVSMILCGEIGIGRRIEWKMIEQQFLANPAENLPHRQKVHRKHIECEYQNLCVAYVSMILCGEIGIGRGIELEMIEQQFFTHNSRKIDKIKIETKQMTTSEIITQIENYYFDITECLD